MEKTILLQILTPDKLIFKDDIRFLVCPGEKGELGILPNHAHMLARLKDGNLRITDKFWKKINIHTNGGFIKVDPHNITILTK